MHSDTAGIASALALAHPQPESPRGERTWKGQVLAAWPRRVAARVADLLLLYTLASVLGGGWSTAEGALWCWIAVVGMGVSVGITGGTPGKWLLGIRIVRTSEARKLGMARGVAREFAHLADSLLFVGYLWPLWDTRGQTFADKIVRSVAVRRGSTPEVAREHGG